jgi:endonuclease-8
VHADAAEVIRRLRAPERADTPVGDALLDQTAGAGLGNVYRSEVCFIERIDPMTPVRELSDAELGRLVETGSRLLRANLEGGARVTMPDALGSQPGTGGPRRPGDLLWVYGRAGRGCRRCRTRIRMRRSGDLARSVYWCPTCQPHQREAAPTLVPGSQRSTSAAS